MPGPSDNPQVIRAVKTKLVAISVLRRKGEFVDQLFEGGLIEQKDYDMLTVWTAWGVKGRPGGK